MLVQHWLKAWCFLTCKAKRQYISIYCLLASEKLPTTRDVDPTLNQCWAAVCDLGPTLIQRWTDVSCLLGVQRSIHGCLRSPYTAHSRSRIRYRPRQIVFFQTYPRFEGLSGPALTLAVNKRRSLKYKQQQNG